jgi:predicted enzyme related to lactoylglutathione lyase
MLGECKVMATIAVKDIERAKKFYSETLGLKQVNEFEGGVTYESGGVALFVYPWAKLEGDVHVTKSKSGREGMAAWFKDPDGNILAMTSGDM